MRIIDIRSGKELAIGDKVEYPAGEHLRLIDADIGMFSGDATVERRFFNFALGAMATETRVIPLEVRWFHPSYLFRQVAFIPS